MNEMFRAGSSDSVGKPAVVELGLQHLQFDDQTVGRGNWRVCCRDKRTGCSQFVNLADIVQERPVREQIAVDLLLIVTAEARSQNETAKPP